MAFSLSFPPLPPPPLHRGYTSPTRNRRNPNSIYSLHLSSSFSSSSSSSPSSSSSWEREEVRWIREENRWLREEQRWLRQESRWNSERESLLQQISDLQLRVESLEREKSASTSSMSDALENLSPVLKALKEADRMNQIAESGSSSRPLLLEEGEVKKTILEEVRVSESVMADQGKKTKKKPLRKGSEGEDVRTMQEALQRLGFYSGEEDMEFSSFSGGTERAVKTWQQATLGTSEDGIMTAELLEKLFMEMETVDSGRKVDSEQKGNPVYSTGKDAANGAPVASVTETAEFKQTVIKESDSDIDVSHHKVFLLGENRWEEPSRLVDRNKQSFGSKGISAARCITCRGEGRLMCAECDGTGEPNIEPQFLEWVGEDTKCPYCEGLGYTICDACGGETTV